MIPISLFNQMDIKSLMVLLESDRIKLDIIKLLYENKEMTLGRLRAKLHTGFKTIKKNCEFLEKIGFITMERKIVGDGKRNITFITLTSLGIKYQKEITISKEPTPY